MRITEKEIDNLKNTLYSLDSEANIYLFGSRIDDNRRGGDIDLLVISKVLTKKDIRLLRINFYKEFGEQRIDIILDNGKFENRFTRMIIKNAVLL